MTAMRCSLAARLGVGALCLLASPLSAQTLLPDPSPAAGADAAYNDVVPAAARDSLMQALSCRADLTDMPGLLGRLRDERPADFTQAQRQYVQPMMDSYRLRNAVSVWGSQGNTVVLTDNRVLLAIAGNVQKVASELEKQLQASADTPLASALDEQHALVVYQSDQPGLQDLVLVGCEYRLPGLSLLQSSYPDLQPPLLSSSSAAMEIGKP